MNNTFRGCGTALLTPFNGNAIDYETYASTVDRQVNSDIDFLVPLGTTGETPTLSDSEKTRILDITLRHAAGRPVVAGVGSNSVNVTMDNIRLLKDADAFLVVVPFYNKPPQRGIYEYFRTIAENTPKPIIIYNVPGRTGSNIEAETTLALARDIPNIAGVKEASGKMDQINTILQERPEGFSVLSGNDDETFRHMKNGADGVISVASNVCPSVMADFVHEMMNGDFESAEVLDRRLHPLFRNLFIEANPTPAKFAMAHLGLMENSLRLPLVTASDDTEEIMINTLKDLQLC